MDDNLLIPLPIWELLSIQPVANIPIFIPSIQIINPNTFYIQYLKRSRPCHKPIISLHIIQSPNYASTHFITPLASHCCDPHFSPTMRHPVSLLPSPQDNHLASHHGGPHFSLTMSHPVSTITSLRHNPHFRLTTIHPASPLRCLLCSPLVSLGCFQQQHAIQHPACPLCSHSASHWLSPPLRPNNGPSNLPLEPTIASIQ